MTTYLQKTLKDCDQVFVNIIERSMKQMYINHAKKSNAHPSLIDDLEKMECSRSIAHIVTIWYGDPK